MNRQDAKDAKGRGRFFLDHVTPFQFQDPAVAIRFADVPSTATTKDEILSSLATALEFPDYFGGNWDALDDCLRDLSWVPQRVICIRHASLPKLPPEELEIYLDVLARAVRSWHGDPSRVLEVSFPPSAREAVVAHSQRFARKPQPDRP